MQTKQLCYILACFVLLLACNKEQETESNSDFRAVIPTNFPAPVYTYATNTATRAGFELGRKLFYDPILSRDNSISCGTCHHQAFAFSDPAHAIPHGIDGEFGTRNSPGIFNVLWNPNFMWDGGILGLEVMPIAPITSSFEMGESLTNASKKLQQHPSYPALFKQAFGSDSITSASYLKALAQFMAAMVSANSKYDKFMRKEASLTAEETLGLSLFKSNCSSCHAGELFTNYAFKNNGIDSVGFDLGRYIITAQERDKGLFRVPTLRNVALTPPYMHDGRFSSLEKVLKHYQSGVLESTQLSSEIRAIKPLSDTDCKAILAFLKTLNDDEFVKNPSFSDPFKNN